MIRMNSEEINLFKVFFIEVSLSVLKFIFYVFYILIGRLYLYYWFLIISVFVRIICNFLYKGKLCNKLDIVIIYSY